MFEQLHPELIPIVHKSYEDLINVDVTENEMEKNKESNSELIELHKGNHGDELPQHNVVLENKSIKDRATYNQLCQITSQLVIAVVNDKEKSNSVMRYVTEWLHRLRINDKFEPTFNTLKNNETNRKITHQYHYQLCYPVLLLHQLLNCTIATKD